MEKRGELSTAALQDKLHLPIRHSASQLLSALGTPGTGMRTQGCGSVLETQEFPAL